LGRDGRDGEAGVRDGLGGAARPEQRQPEVALEADLVGPESQRLLQMRDRRLPETLALQRGAEVAVADPARGVDVEGGLPERLGVRPRVDLAGGEAPE